MAQKQSPKDSAGFVQLITSGAEINSTDIEDIWQRGRAELFVDMVTLAHDFVESDDILDFLDRVYLENDDLGRSIDFRIFTKKRGQTILKVELEGDNGE